MPRNTPPPPPPPGRAPAPIAHAEGSAPPDASVIIPTHGRSAKLAACLGRLARQDIEPWRYEVIVVLDGPDPESEAAAQEAWGRARHEAGRTGPVLRVIPMERAGLAAARNRALADARGAIMISVNDDVLACPGFVRAHVDAQQMARERGLGTRDRDTNARPTTHDTEPLDGLGGCVVSGWSPWVVHEPDRLFDRMLRETSMVFFYDAMEREADACAARGGPGSGRMDDWKNWGFRHAWGLNMSAPMWAARRIGAARAENAPATDAPAPPPEVFKQLPARYGYEDLEFAWRCAERFGMPVVFRSEARADHDHRLDPRQYLERELLLGRSAPGFASACPECARAVFGRDVGDGAELDYARAFVERERATAERLQGLFESAARMSGALADGPTGRSLVELAYAEHLLVKRWWWRRGVVEASRLPAGAQAP